LTAADWAPPHARPFAEAVIAATQADSRIVGLAVGGSAATGTMDEFSDLDFVVVCREEHQAGLLAQAPAFAAGLGPLLACFTGEHVGEPRLLITLYGPPPVHVDLKFISEGDLDQRVEDGLVLWQRDGVLDAALRRAPAVWPRPDPQWVEDRFWVWVHYGAAKLGRGELFECLDMLAAMRGMVFGPLIAHARGRQAAGVRRLEQTAPDLVPALQATVGDHTPHGCAAALRASVRLYRQLRGDAAGLVRRTSAEDASLGYLAQIEARLPALGHR
jgi:nucleotidyltransferase-like protein